MLAAITLSDRRLEVTENQALIISIPKRPRRKVMSGTIMRQPLIRNRATRRKQKLTTSILLILAAVGAVTAQSNSHLRPLSSTDVTRFQTSVPALGIKEISLQPALSQTRSGEVSRSLPDLVIDHYEITNSSRGEVKIVVVNKGGGSSGPSTLRLIVLKAGRLGQKEAATVFAKVPTLAAGQATFIFVKAGVPISKRKHAISIDITEDSK